MFLKALAMLCETGHVELLSAGFPVPAYGVEDPRRRLASPANLYVCCAHRCIHDFTSVALYGFGQQPVKFRENDHVFWNTRPRHLSITDLPNQFACYSEPWLRVVAAHAQRNSDFLYKRSCCMCLFCRAVSLQHQAGFCFCVWVNFSLGFGEFNTQQTVAVHFPFLFA